jgi:hypothetical protein
MSTLSDEQLRQFLMRGVPPELATEIEDAVLLEDGLAERLREQEFDLLDDYAAGRLNDADRGAVERHLLNSRAGAHSLRVARLLPCARAAPTATPAPAVSARAAPSRARRRIAWAPIAALACAAALVAVFVVPDRPTTAPPHKAVSTSPPLVTSTATAAALPILSLLADVDRGASATELHWPPGFEAVRLQVELPDAPSPGSYWMTVDDAAGRRLFQSGPLSAQAAGRLRYVEAVVPTAALGPGVRRIALRRDTAVDEQSALLTRQVVGTPD